MTFAGELNPGYLPGFGNSERTHDQRGLPELDLRRIAKPVKKAYEIYKEWKRRVKRTGTAQ